MAGADASAAASSSVACLAALLACAASPVEALAVATNAVKAAPPPPEALLADGGAALDGLLALAAAWLAREEGAFDNVLFCIAIIAELAAGALAHEQAVAGSGGDDAAGGAASARRGALVLVLSLMCQRICRLRAQLRPPDTAGACVHAMLALGHMCRLAHVEADAPELAGVAARFLSRIACAFAPLAAHTDVPASAEALLGALRVALPVSGGAEVLRAALAEARTAASRASLALALRITRDALAEVTTPATRALLDEALLKECCSAVESSAGDVGVTEQGLACINNALHHMTAMREGRALASPCLLRRLVAAAACALGGDSAGAGVLLPQSEQAARVLQQLVASEPLAQVDLAAALVADYHVLDRAARALQAAGTGAGLRGPASRAQGAAVHVMRLLGSLALSPAICLAQDDALPRLLAALRALFVEGVGVSGAGSGALPPSYAVYAATGELVARLLALDEGGSAGAALRAAALGLGDALEEWWAAPQ